MTGKEYYMVLVKLNFGWSLDMGTFSYQEANQARRQLKKEGYRSIVLVSCKYNEVKTYLQRYGIT